MSWVTSSVFLALCCLLGYKGDIFYGGNLPAGPAGLQNIVILFKETTGHFMTLIRLSKTQYPPNLAECLKGQRMQCRYVCVRTTFI